MTQPPPRPGNVTRSPVVYLPIEFQSREFDSKVLLAAALAQRGYGVVLGQQWLLYNNLTRLPPGVVLFKSFNKFHQPSMTLARQAGHRVVILEEELLAQTETKAVEALSTDGIFALPDLILADGQFEHDILKRLSGGKVPIEITGNGRIDLLKPDLRPLFQKLIDDIKRRHGDFVLVNTNFSITNSIWQSTDQVTQIQKAAGFLKPADPASAQIWQDYIDYEEANRAAMHTAIRELARRRPKQSIIVRPHPGEDLKRWDGLFAEYPNVSIIREGAHIPWTLACRVLLHTSCTTGFEAQVAGKAALSLVPRPSWITASLLSNQVNATFDDPIEFVAAAEKILDGGAAPSPKPAAKPPEYYIWNCGAHNATQRIADLLVQGLPPPKAVAFAPLTTIARDEKLKSKFDVSLMRCSQAIQSVRDTRKFSQDIAVQELGDSLFAVAPTGQIRINLAPKLDQKQIRAAMDTALRGGNFKQAFDIFKQNFGEAHRNSELCFMAGVACFELGDYALALQYLQHATIPDSNAVNLNIVFMLARTYQKLGEFETARRYIELAYRQVPTSPIFFSLLKELSAAAGKPVPQHWVVIGCSHVRYFRYIQVNQPRFFDGRVHLECYEFAGATAYGLGNPASDSGALKATRELQPRIALADRVLIYFGEIDCRRAAWKAAVTSGRSIDETIAESVAHLKTYIEREILPHNKTVLLLGPKPQIIGDDDFYKNALEDERTIFKPLEVREKVALGFNRQLGGVAKKLKIDYADIDDVLASDASRRDFFAHVFWDHYEDDTHGNVDHFARLYFDKLKAFCQ